MQRIVFDGRARPLPPGEAAWALPQVLGCEAGHGGRRRGGVGAASRIEIEDGKKGDREDEGTARWMSF